MKKKILMIITIVISFAIIIVSNFINKSFADTVPAVFKLNQVETKIGDEINIELTLTNEKAFLSVDFVVNYDSTKLEYVSYTKGNIENFTIYANESEKGKIKIAGIQDPAQSRTVSANTSLIKLEFKVIDGNGTESNIELGCDSLYVSETETALTVQNNGKVTILNVVSMQGKIITDNTDEVVHLYMYKEDGNILVNEDEIGANGEYCLDVTEPGSYYIKIKKAGYLEYNITGINITEINNIIKNINDIQLVPGDTNDDGEIELLDLVKTNDILVFNEQTDNLKIDRETIKSNYGKKSENIDINNIGYED